MTTSYYVFLVKGNRVLAPMKLPIDPWDAFVRMARIAIRGRKCDFGVVVSERKNAIQIIGVTEIAEAGNVPEILVNHAEAYPKFTAAWTAAVAKYLGA